MVAGVVGAATLVADSKAYSFDETEESALDDFLADVNRNTLLLPVLAPTDVLLQEDGRTRAGYRYTDSALNQLCRVISSGLAAMLPEIAGAWRTAVADPRDYSVSLAREIFNKLVVLRFDRRARSLQLVCNAKEKLIEGVVGARYRYLSNGEFVLLVKSIMASEGNPVFHEAMVLDRRLYIRYKWPAMVAAAAIDPTNTHSVGIHFANSEVGGGSVRAAVLLVRDTTNDSSFGPYGGNSGNRMIHAGTDFGKRLHRLLIEVIGRVRRRETSPGSSQNPMGSYFAGKLSQLYADRLHLGGTDHDGRIQRLSSALTRRKLPIAFVRHVVSSMLVHGHNPLVLDPAEDLGEDRSTIVATRTGYDVYAAICREARRLPLYQREQAEQTAYSLLTREFSL